jgi:ferredoxin-NADP reductase
MSATLRVTSIAYEAEGICSFELRDPSDCELTPFTAGAHIDLRLPNGMSKSYSLINSQDDRHRYLIAVNNDVKGRGGSRYLHERVRPGDLLTVDPPRNNFSLVEDAEHSVLIGGGIGITPLWSMVQRLESKSRPWTLFYCARSRQHAAFLKKFCCLEHDHPGRVHFSFDDENAGKHLDLEEVLYRVSSEAHIYCCGPAGMLDAFEKASIGIKPGHAHVEHFTGKVLKPSSHGFRVVLAKSGRTIDVLPGQTILEALQEAGVYAPFSCREGVCGTCEVRVLQGVADHRDTILTEQEKASNRTMMVCCSLAKSEELVLDL